MSTTEYTDLNYLSRPSGRLRETSKATWTDCLIQKVKWRVQ